MRDSLRGFLLALSLAAAGLAPGEDKNPPPAEKEDGPHDPAEAGGKPTLVLEAGAHRAPIRKVLFTPDNKQVITLSSDRTIRVWDVKTGRTLRALRMPRGEGSAGELTAGAISPDGKVLAAGCWVRKEDAPGGVASAVCLITLADGKIRTLPGHEGVVDVLAFSPRDGKYLASGGGDGTARVWDAAGAKCLHVFKGHKAIVTDLAFSPDGERLVTVSQDKTGHLWSVKTGNPEGVLEGHAGALWCVAWSPDGKTIVAGGNERKLHLWDADGKARSPLVPDPAMCALLDLDFKSRDPNDSREVVYTWRRRRGDGWNFGVSYLDLVSGESRRALVMREGSGASPMSTAFSSDRTLGATSGGDNNQLYLWTTLDGEVVHRLESQGKPIFSVGWGTGEKDRATVAWGVMEKPGDHNPPLSRAFNLAELTPAPRPDLARFQGPLLKVGELSLTHPDHNSARGWTMTVREGNKVLARLQLPGDSDAYTLVQGDKAAVAVGGSIYLYDARTGRQLRRVLAHRLKVRALAPSPDGRYLVWVLADQTVRVTSLEDDRALVKLYSAGNEWVAWTTEGYYAASAGGERLMGWQVNNGPDRLASFYPASQFRASLYRPDVIQRLLAEGSLEKALAAADKVKGVPGSKVIEVDEVLPPTVILTAPGLARDGKTTKPVVEVEARALGTGKHPVTSVQIMLDGRPYRGAAGLRKVAARPGEAVTEKWKVEIPEGDHTLRAVARSDASMGLSDDLDITFTEPAPKPHLYLLAVGINDYADKDLSLSCAVNDAQELDKTFKEYSKELFEVDSKVLVNGQATREKMLEGLRWLKAKMKPHDQAVIFYAGHGEKDGKSFYLLPQDVNAAKLAETGISGDVLKQHLANLPGKVLLLLDACHSGAIGRVINDMARDLADDDCGVVVMCAALGSERAGEGKVHGYFCQAMIEALAGKGPKNPRDGRVYQHHLEQYVIDTVQERSKGAQHPTTAKPTLPPFPLAKP